MRFPTLLAALAVPAVSLAPAAALAKCAAPGAFLAPHTGDLPRDPALHLFVPGWNRDVPELTVKDEAGNALEHELIALDSSKAMNVFRIEIKSERASEIHVAFESWSREKAFTYRVDSRYAPAPRSAVRIENVTASSYAWTCSHEELQELAVDTTAPVFRVELAASESDFRAGTRESIFLPHRFKEIAFRWNEAPVPADAVLPLGHINCTGATMDWSKGTVWAAVVAIYPDGSETPLGEPIAIKAPPVSRGRGRMP